MQSSPSQQAPRSPAPEPLPSPATWLARCWHPKPWSLQAFLAIKSQATIGSRGGQRRGNQHQPAGCPGGRRSGAACGASGAPRLWELGSCASWKFMLQHTTGSAIFYSCRQGSWAGDCAQAAGSRTHPKTSCSTMLLKCVFQRSQSCVICCAPGFKRLGSAGAAACKAVDGTDATACSSAL